MRSEQKYQGEMILIVDHSSASSLLVAGYPLRRHAGLQNGSVIMVIRGHHGCVFVLCSAVLF
jgi:hypothetical protein